MSADAASYAVRREPAAPLTGLVAGYSGYRIATPSPGLHRGLPAPAATFIVAFDDGIDVVRQTDSSQAPARYRALVGGLHATPALIAYDTLQEGLQIDLTPTGVRALLGIPLAALWNTTAHLDDVAPGLSRELVGRLADASWDERYAVCDTVFARAARTTPPDPQLAFAWHRLIAPNDPTAIDAVAGELGWSRQRLARRFAAEFGPSPGTVRRIARFDRARRMVTPERETGLGRVAVECGYADQAHFTREFHAMAGCTPSRLHDDPTMAVPFVQDGSPDR